MPEGAPLAGYVLPSSVRHPLGSLFPRPVPLCVWLIDSGAGPLDTRVLQLNLAPIVLDRGLGGFDRRTSLCHLRLVVVVPEFNKNVFAVHLLKIGDLHVPNQTRNLRAEWRQIASNIGIICDLFAPATFPAVPVPHNSDDDCSGE